ncbi:MAG: HsdR family type I site-specific deoxyribonuclease [Deltaproteobacteria bacterium]|nr:HsdR family type I site-specific deoxyribonuclease [Deltaproteobacteria bacterium]
MKPIFNEDTLSESPAIAQLKRMGYGYIHGDELDPELRDDCERASRREVVLVSRLKKTLAEINPRLTEESINKAVRRITHIHAENLIEANRTFHQDLVAGISINQDIGAKRQKLTVRYINFDDPKKNEFLAVNQFWVKGPKQTDRPDIVIFINGIPFVVIECKSPVAKQMGISEGIVQLQRYQEEIPNLFHTNQILIALNLFGAKYGTILSSAEFSHEWKAPGKEKFPNMAEHPSVQEMLKLDLIKKDDLSERPTQQEVLIAGILNKRNLLDIIQNFIVFEKEKAKTVKKVCRYQQFTAVNKILKRVTTEEEKKGIIWHWQGSGKSLTMLFAAVKLRREEEKLKNPIILVVTDRIDLDDQISKTFRNCRFPNPIQIREKGGTHRKLYELLSQDVGQTILTTVHLFRKPPDKPLSEAENIIVLTDEAHRTQYGFYALNLRRALPNASFFAFTGTPLSKRDRNTYRHFSPPGERYLDAYTIHNAEEDQEIVPVRYASRLARLQVVGKSLDQLFEDLFQDKTEEEKAILKKKYGTAATIARADRRIEGIAHDMVEHFNDKIRPNGFKAQIVAADREMAIRYKEIMDKLIGPERSEIVITINNGDPKEWKEKYRRTREDEKQIKEAFNDPRNPLQFLIVCDKLLTGFDAPVEQVMYLDQRLKEHTLLQAVARTNRTYHRKEFGLVVDYVGIGRELAEALVIFEKEDLEGIFGVDDISRELANLDYWHKKTLSFFEKIDRTREKPEDILQQCMEILKPKDVRADFDAAFLSMAKSMDFLMPDPKAAPYLADFKFFGTIREGARNLYRDERLSLIECSRKVEALIHAHIAETGMEQILEPINITAPDFREKLEVKGSSKAKASHVEYAIRQTITEKIATDPAFYGSLRDRLEKLIEEDRKERQDEAKLLLDLLDMSSQEKQREVYAHSLGLQNVKEFSFYGVLSPFRESLFLASEKEQASFTGEVIEAIKAKTVIDWTEKNDVQREMRREIKSLLRQRGFQEEQVEPLTGEIMNLARIHLKET